MYKNFVEEFSDLQSALDMYYVSLRFTFAYLLTDEIFQDIVERFPTSPEVVFLQASRSTVRRSEIESSEESSSEQQNMLREYIREIEERKSKKKTVG